MDPQIELKIIPATHLVQHLHSAFLLTQTKVSLHLQIFALGGNDNVKIDDSVFQTTTLDGGSGDDDIVGSLQTDVIFCLWIIRIKVNGYL